MKNQNDSKTNPALTMFIFAHISKLNIRLT